jgi:large subunit ribosomal protein L35
VLTISTDLCILPGLYIQTEQVVFKEKAMPKQKTHKGLAKRVKVTATGKVKRSRAGGSHLLSNKNRKRLRKIKGSALVPKIFLKTTLRELRAD